jgi:hypothetical protein
MAGAARARVLWRLHRCHPCCKICAGLIHGESRYPPSFTLFTATILLVIGVAAILSMVCLNSFSTPIRLTVVSGCQLK